MQPLSPALVFCAEGAPEWRVLLDLAAALDLDHAYFEALGSPADILAVLKKEIAFFA